MAQGAKGASVGMCWVSAVSLSQSRAGAITGRRAPRFETAAVGCLARASCTIRGTVPTPVGYPGPQHKRSLEVTVFELPRRVTKARVHRSPTGCRGVKLSKEQA